MNQDPEIRVHEGQGQIRCPVCKDWKLELMATIPAPQPPPTILSAWDLKKYNKRAKQGTVSGVCTSCMIRAFAGMIAGAPSRQQVEQMQANAEAADDEPTGPN